MNQHKVSKHLKKPWAGATLVMLAFIGSLLFISPALASSNAKPISKSSVGSKKQQMKYDVFAGGFHVVSADLNVDLAKKDSYVLRLGAYTHGMLAKLAPWKGIFETKGWYDSKKSFPRPQIHSSNTTWRDENEVVEFVYNKDGSFKEHRIFNEKEKGKQDPKPELSDNTTDVLSATLQVMNKIAGGGKCEGSDKIFDGSRSYDLVYRHQKQEMLKGNALNVYSGPATECTIEVKPIAGKWHEKPRGWMSIQEQGRERGTMPTIWFAQMAAGEPAVPVKIRVKTEYGALIMHLTHYKGAGKTLELPKD